MNTSGFQNISDEELRAVTGKSWKDWCELLDTSDARNLSLTAITNYLILHHQLRRLWAQTIAVYYKWNWCSSQTNG
jgi:hypothetical protein